MKRSTVCAAFAFFALEAFALVPAQSQSESCSSILCTCDFSSSNSECETKLCTSLDPQTISTALWCSDDFINTNIGLCCTSSDPAACLSALQETSSVCSAGRTSSDELRIRQEGRAVDSEHVQKAVEKRDYSYDSYSTGDSYDEDQSGCMWNFDGASTAGACGDYGTSDYGGSSADIGSSYDGSGASASGAKKTLPVAWTMLVAVAAGFVIM